MNLPRVTMVVSATGALLAAGCQLLAGVHTDAVVGTGGAGGAVVMHCVMASDCNDNNVCTDDVCSGAVCSSVANNMVVPDDYNECTVDACMNGAVTHDGAARMGQKCGKGVSLFCDGSGNCHGCVQDADCATSTDCRKWACDTTTSNCAPQDAPLGKVTTDPMAGDCLGAVCDGTGGTLVSPLPARTVCTVTGGKLCDAMAHCVACTIDTDCMPKGTCRSGICLTAAGGTCLESPTCETDLCTLGTCAACKMDSDCKSMKCTVATGVCGAAFGEPCFATSDCAGGQCLGGLCFLPVGSPCVNEGDCVTGRCVTGSCTPCMSSAECTNMVCASVIGIAGVCTLPGGAYCKDNTQCASGACSGFPAKCM